ncbi:hypothetical protein C8Q79DRAFT_993344 [Trametes meyenii]|nr:hypothetical protein C8Q79DRAFT_993344 [Trametes meyenii]
MYTSTRSPLVCYKFQITSDIFPGVCSCCLFHLMHLLLSSFHERTFSKWSKTYGEAVIFRMCPGQALADNSLWLAITNIVAPRASIVRIRSFFACLPTPYTCNSVPRSGKAASRFTHPEV